MPAAELNGHFDEQYDATMVFAEWRRPAGWASTSLPSQPISQIQQHNVIQLMSVSGTISCIRRKDDYVPPHHLVFQ